MNFSLSHYKPRSAWQPSWHVLAQGRRTAGFSRGFGCEAKQKQLLFGALGAKGLLVVCFELMQASPLNA